MCDITLKTSDFFYELPEQLIAQTPASPRDNSRLMVYDRLSGAVEDKHFFDLPQFLQRGDVLVVNNTKVLPARIFGIKADTGARVEFLLHKRENLTDWEVLVRPAKKAKPGSTFVFSEHLSATVLEWRDEGARKVRFAFDGTFEEALAQVGEMPLPPYIHEKLSDKDKDRYQTVYAKTDGSSAAPTAGLHFTTELMQRIKAMGVTFAEVLLHVGLGTFRPVKTENILEHKMHSEYYSIGEDTAKIINDAKKEGRRVICVGTTSVRTVESAATAKGVVAAGSGDTDIFIYPPYDFKIADAIITNFHLPSSTLIMLVSAFLGREKTLELYRRAVDNKYRFFSFGDACLFQ